MSEIALALAATLSAGFVMAEGPQLYAVLGAGKAEFQDYCKGAQDCDDSDTSWKIAGGAQAANHHLCALLLHKLHEQATKPHHFDIGRVKHLFSQGNTLV
jgi:hypothetical protein